MTRTRGEERASLQGDAFSVNYVSGDVLEKLLGFAEQVDRPEKLLLRFRQSGHCTLFLSAFFAHWDALDDRELVELYQDYKGVPLVDYGTYLNIGEQAVRSVECATLNGSASVSLVLETGTLFLYATDPSDPHSDSAFDWRPVV